MKNREIENLRKKFEQIPVPPELEERVRASIGQAKREKENGFIMKARKIVIGAGATAAAVMLSITVLANSGEGIASAMEGIPVLGAITRVVTFRTYEDEENGASAHIEIPKVEDGGELNDEIQRYTDTIIAQYEADTAVIKEADGEGHYELDLSYQVVTDNERMFTLRFNQSLVMASGNESVKIYNVDKATGKIMSLGDLFKANSNYLDVLTANIQEQMQAEMDADENVQYWLNSEVPEFDFTALSEDATFYVNEDGELVIVFNEGDVAPMYMGVCEFAIPADVTVDIAQPAYFGK